MLTFYHQLADALERGTVVLATVTAVKGSVPREVGAKMGVCVDGSLFGTIGGGAGEAKVYHQALAVLQSGEKQFVSIDLSGAPQRDTQGVCGGQMQLWLEHWEGEAARSLVQQIVKALTLRQAGAIVTPFHTKKFPYLLQPSDLTTIQVTPEGMVEPLLPPPLLVIVGAGHVAVPLAQIAQLAGFEIVVVDDRPEFACPDRFPVGATVLAQPVTQALAHLPAISDLYAALVTRGYQHDLEPLQVLLNRPVRYIGMIGSEKRVRLVQQALLKKGYGAELLKTLYAPIGLDIGALTPEEIAVSICAELIQVRRGGTGRALSERWRQE